MYGASPNLAIPPLAGNIFADGRNAFTAEQSMGGNQLTNVGTPSADTDAATKGYVDAVAEGLDVKASVRAATTAAVTLASDLENGDTLDGVTLATGDRVLVKDQATASENGIYVVGLSGAPARADDLAAGAGAAGAFVFVEEGTVNADSGWVCTSNDGSDVVGTNDLAWAQFSGAGQITAGNALTKTGNTLDVAVDGSTIQVTGDALAVIPGGVDHDALLNFVANEHVDHSTVSISAGGALSGGGTIAANRTITLDVSAQTEVTAPVLTADYLLLHSASAAAHRKVRADRVGAWPRGFIDGLTLSNSVVDSDHDIAIAAGACRDAGDAVNMAFPVGIIKQIDAAWAVGNNQGGLDTGSVAANTWYYAWLIRRSDTGVVDVLFSTSASAPTMPTNYDQKRRIGAFITDGSANIRAFSQLADHFLLSSAILDVDATNPGTSAVLRTLSVPSGIQVWAIINYLWNADSVTSECVLSAIDAADAAPSISAAPLSNSRGNSTFSQSGQLVIRTDTLGRIRSRVSASAAGSFLRIATLGWIDLRGKA